LKSISERWKQNAFFSSWLLSSLFFAWQLVHGVNSFESPGIVLNLLALLLCTSALLVWIPNPVHDPPSERPTRRWLLALLILIAAVILFPLRMLVGPPLLFGLPVVALVALILLRRWVSIRDVLYALFLALIAGVAGLAAGWITEMSLLVWALLQVLLVLTGFLGGWAILRHSRLAEQGVGRSLVLSAGASRGALGFLLGMLIAVPWALSNLVMGGSASELWVRLWWQPLVAIQPGIAEEAWGRLLLVPLLFLLFRLAARPRTALTAALVLAAYWFAYLHTPGGIEAIPSTLIIGTLFSLPVSYLCLYRDLETAIGWHFLVDFVKFAYAFALVAR
jgi:hypothetical protein